MTDLQASLTAIGGLVVIGVLSYNKWQEWRAKKSVDQAFSPLQDDVLMGSGSGASRQDPVFSPFDEPDVEQLNVQAGPSLSEEPRFAELVRDGHQGLEQAFAEPRTDAMAGAPARTHRAPVLDGLLDCVIPLLLDAPLRGEKILSAFQHLHLVGSKPVRVVGENEAGTWEEVGMGGVYAALQVGVQLATRSGPLTELEFSELVSRLNHLADELAAQPDLPDMAEVIGLARALFQRVQEFDAQLSINVRANSAPWSLATLRPALQRQGMEARPDGRLVMPDGEGGVLFTVIVNSTPAEETCELITLLLPVARVAPEHDGFKAMSALAKSLASRLSGTVVDDNGQPLSDAALAVIAAQVREFCQAMEQARLPAGSARALRLFA